ncbi:hypothetical protein GGR53DRAFT_73319 [Hypoxylon sp. FL1150]|nr:hypothetical protein GGR53DRAFT_73319 [Hypoxylon sp. FL1150]
MADGKSDNKRKNPFASDGADGERSRLPLPSSLTARATHDNPFHNASLPTTISIPSATNAVGPLPYPAALAPPGLPAEGTSPDNNVPASQPTVSQGPKNPFLPLRPEDPPARPSFSSKKSVIIKGLSRPAAATPGPAGNGGGNNNGNGWNRPQQDVRRGGEEAISGQPTGSKPSDGIRRNKPSVPPPSSPQKSSKLELERELAAVSRQSSALAARTDRLELTIRDMQAKEAKRQAATERTIQDLREKVAKAQASNAILRREISQLLLSASRGMARGAPTRVQEEDEDAIMANTTIHPF